MNNSLEKIFDSARQSPARIVLPEGEDERVIQAAGRAKESGIAKPVLLGNADVIERMMESSNSDASEISILDPSNSPLLVDFGEEWLDLRKHKGLSRQQAEEQVTDAMLFGALLVRSGHADGLIGGAVYTTADTLRYAIQAIGVSGKLVSSFMLMLSDEPYHQSEPVMLFADCALVVDPNAEEMAEIAIATADSARNLLGLAPKIAMLSFSTGGSAKHERVDKVQQAVEIAKMARPDLQLDGEMQLDSAIVLSVANSKMPGSIVAGHANVLIFPSLEAGNIGYKLAQRMGNVTAVGPVLQGLNKPANDLSRGCSADDIYQLLAVTSVQSKPVQERT